MATAPSPNDLTRQQLDELDALLQRMLSIPLNPSESASPPAQPGVVSVTTSSPAGPALATQAPPPTSQAPPPSPTSTWRVDSPPPGPGPLPRVIPASPPRSPASSEVVSAPPRPGGNSERDAPPARQPSPPRPEEKAPHAVREPAPAPQATPAKVDDIPKDQVAHTTIPEDNVPEAIPYDDALAMTASLPETASSLAAGLDQAAAIPLHSPAPASTDGLMASKGQDSHASTATRPKRKRLPLLVWPLVLVNILIDGPLRLFGKPGRFLTSGLVKTLLGIIGLAGLLYTLAYVAQQRGLLDLGQPLPWPEPPPSHWLERLPPRAELSWERFSSWLPTWARPGSP